MKTFKRKLSAKEKADIKKKKARLYQLRLYENILENRMNKAMNIFRKAENRFADISWEIDELQDEIEHP